MALNVAPQVVNGIRTLFEDGHFRGRTYVTTTAIPAMLSAWYDIELPAGALRDTLSAAGIEPSGRRYSLGNIYRELAEGGRLWQVAERTLERMEAGEVRVSPAASNAEPLGQAFLAVDVPALARRVLVPYDDDQALADAVRKGVRLGR